MEDPTSEISSVIHILTQGSPSAQTSCIATYFTPTASFTHPFCRTGSFGPEYLPNISSSPLSSRWLILQIYRWYKILSPSIELSVDSVAFDEKNLLLYVGIHQVFRIQWIPFHQSDVRLTTVLVLVEDEVRQAEIEEKEAKQAKKLVKSDYAALALPKRKYRIQSQNDLYQTSELVKFVMPWGGGMAIMLWQYFATLMCVLGAFVMWPVTYLAEVKAERQEAMEKEADARHLKVQEVEEEHDVGKAIVQKVKGWVSGGGGSEGEKEP